MESSNGSGFIMLPFAVKRCYDKYQNKILQPEQLIMPLRVLRSLDKQGAVHIMMMSDITIKTG